MRIVESGSPIGILIELPRIKCTKHRGQAITITQLASMTYIKPLVYRILHIASTIHAPPCISASEPRAVTADVTVKIERRSEITKLKVMA